MRQNKSPNSRKADAGSNQRLLKTNILWYRSKTKTIKILLDRNLALQPGLEDVPEVITVTITSRIIKRSFQMLHSFHLNPHAYVVLTVDVKPEIFRFDLCNL